MTGGLLNQDNMASLGSVAGLLVAEGAMVAAPVGGLLACESGNDGQLAADGGEGRELNHASSGDGCPLVGFVGSMAGGSTALAGCGCVSGGSDGAATDG